MHTGKKRRRVVGKNNIYANTLTHANKTDEQTKITETQYQLMKTVSGWVDGDDDDEHRATRPRRCAFGGHTATSGADSPCAHSVLFSTHTLHTGCCSTHKTR